MKLESGSANPYSVGRKYWMHLKIDDATEDEMRRVMSLIGRKVAITEEK